VTSADQVSLSADGSRLVFRSAALASNPVAIPFDPVAERSGPPRQILDRTGILAPTGISPDGQWLVLANTFERQEDLFVMRPDGTGIRRITDDAFRDRAGVWSPDGKEIAFYSNRKDNYGIWAVRPDGGGLREVTEAPAGNLGNFLYPVYSPTGDRLVTSRVRTPETIMIDPHREWAAQKPEQLQMKLPDGSWLVPSAWSPDGRLLIGATVAGAAAGVGVYDVAARTTRLVPGVACQIQNFAWLDSKRVLCVDTVIDTLWLVDVESGRRKSVASDLNLGGVIVWSPGSRTLYAGVSRQQADVWMVETKAKSK
jgi:Tol biopolymer transport system component